MCEICADGCRGAEAPRRQPEEEPTTDYGQLIAALKEAAGIGHVEDREVKTRRRIALLSFLHLARDPLGGGAGEVFHRADAHAGGKENEEQAVFIHALNE